VNGTDLDYGGDIGPGTGTTTHIWTLGGTGGSIVLPGADFLASGGVAPSTLWAASVM
jgi:hypothetical protein